MAEPASRSVPRHAIGTHSLRTTGTRPVEVAKTVELSCSDLESVEEEPSAVATSPKELAGSETPAASAQTPERLVPVAARHHRSRSLILAAIVVTLCAAVTVGAFAFTRSNSHPSGSAQRGQNPKSAPTATSVPAHGAAQPAPKKRSTANAQLASVRAVHPQAGQKPSPRGAATSGTAKGKVKQSGPVTQGKGQGKTKPNGPVAKGRTKANGAR